MLEFSEYKKATRAFAALQEQLQETILPWATMIETINKAWKPIDYSFYTEALQSYSALTKSSQKSLYSSFHFPLGSNDLSIEDDPLSEEDYTEIIESAASYNTSSVDINKINQADLDFFRTRSDEVADAMAKTDFEDGVDNDITDLVRSYIKKNKSATYNWLNELFGKYATNSSVVEGLLRTLAMVTEKGDESILSPIVIAGMRSEIPSEQEAAIMVIEEWRTKECLDALKKVAFKPGWIQSYGNKVIKELEKELG